MKISLVQKLAIVQELSSENLFQHKKCKKTSGSKNKQAGVRWTLV